MNRCPTCKRENVIVNQCGCDPHNMPTRPATWTYNRETEAIIGPQGEEIGRIEPCSAPLAVAAPEMLEALEAAQCPCWVHNAALTNDIEALRRIAVWYSKWNNDVRLPAIRKAKGEA